jgi:hypothetical protein
MLVDLLRIITHDLAVVPMYYVLDVYAIRAGLKGATPASPGEAWTTANAHLLYWER